MRDRFISILKLKMETNKVRVKCVKQQSVKKQFGSRLFSTINRDFKDSKTGTVSVVPCDVCILPLNEDQPGVLCRKYTNAKKTAPQVYSDIYLINTGPWTR